MPAGLQGKTIDDVEVGEPLGRSWILLGGLIPVDFDDLRLVELEPGRRFLERSRTLTFSRLATRARGRARGRGELPGHRSARLRASPGACLAAGLVAARADDRRRPFSASSSAAGAPSLRGAARSTRRGGRRQQDRDRRRAASYRSAGEASELVSLRQLGVLAGEHLGQGDHHLALLPGRVVLHLAVDHVDAAPVGDRLEDLLGELDLVGRAG